MSKPRPSRPNRSQTVTVVPEPENGSRQRPPGGQSERMKNSARDWGRASDSWPNLTEHEALPPAGAGIDEISRVGYVGVNDEIKSHFPVGTAIASRYDSFPVFLPVRHRATGTKLTGYHPLLYCQTMRVDRPSKSRCSSPRRLETNRRLPSPVYHFVANSTAYKPTRPASTTPTSAPRTRASTCDPSSHQRQPRRQPHG